MHIKHFLDHYDLVTPDGVIEEIHLINTSQAEAIVSIERISPYFVGYRIPLSLVFFNLKSTLAQLGIDAHCIDCLLEPKTYSARVKIQIKAIGPIGVQMIALLEPGAYIGKLFAADDRRRVRDPEYLTRMFGRADRNGRPLLSLGGLQGGNDLILEKVEGRTIAYLSLLNGAISYDANIIGLLPTLAKALKKENIRTRDIIKLHQEWHEEMPRALSDHDILLVKTLPLHIRTVFGRVVQELLPTGIAHTSACVLQPDTQDSGDVYEVFGNSSKQINDIPLEFYTLEPYREHVFFCDRDQLQECIENPVTLFAAFDTAPAPRHHLCATYIVKGEQLKNLVPTDWIATNPIPTEFPGLIHPNRQALMVQHYITEQPSYPFLKAIEEGSITSQGILLVRHFPSPLMKRMLLADRIQLCLKGIYFELPSLSFGDYFSHEDRSLVHDLAKYAIPVYWVDRVSNKILQFVPKPGKDSGMFVPLAEVKKFLHATVFGIYGSNLIEGKFEGELAKLMKSLLDMRHEFDHPLFHKEIPLALVTGGGPGVMELGNRIAKDLGILSCANIVDFRTKTDSIINEQKQNPYIDAKMTYRLDRLVERQGEFNLDFPIFLEGGYGTDFEYALEEIRRKVGSIPPHPVLLFGTREYWCSKITSRFQCNLKAGTIQGSEWVSNCFYCIQTAQQGIHILRRFFSNTLPIGKNGPNYEAGFVDSF